MGTGLGSWLARRLTPPVTGPRCEVCRVRRARVPVILESAALAEVCRGCAEEGEAVHHWTVLRPGAWSGA